MSHIVSPTSQTAKYNLPKEGSSESSSLTLQGTSHMVCSHTRLILNVVIELSISPLLKLQLLNCLRALTHCKEQIDGCETKSWPPRPTFSKNSFPLTQFWYSKMPCVHPGMDRGLQNSFLHNVLAQALVAFTVVSKGTLILFSVQSFPCLGFVRFQSTISNSSSKSLWFCCGPVQWLMSPSLFVAGFLLVLREQKTQMEGNSAVRLGGKPRKFLRTVRHKRITCTEAFHLSH